MHRHIMSLGQYFRVPARNHPLISVAPGDTVCVRPARDLVINIVSRSALPKGKITVASEQYPYFLAEVLYWWLEDADRTLEVLESIGIDPEGHPEIKEKLA